MESDENRDAAADDEEGRPGDLCRSGAALLRVTRDTWHVTGIDGVTPAERDKWCDIDAVYGSGTGSEPRCLDTVDTV